MKNSVKKFIIWFVCILVYSLITTLLSYFGFQLGAIPIFILLGIFFAIAKALTKKLCSNEPTETKNIEKKNTTSEAERSAEIISFYEDAKNKGDESQYFSSSSDIIHVNLHETVSFDLTYSGKKRFIYCVLHGNSVETDYVVTKWCGKKTIQITPKSVGATVLKFQDDSFSSKSRFYVLVIVSDDEYNSEMNDESVNTEEACNECSEIETSGTSSEAMESHISPINEDIEITETIPSIRFSLKERSREIELKSNARVRSEKIRELEDTLKLLINRLTKLEFSSKDSALLVSKKLIKFYRSSYDEYILAKELQKIVSNQFNHIHDNWFQEMTDDLVYIGKKVIKESSLYLSDKNDYDSLALEFQFYVFAFYIKELPDEILSYAKSFDTVEYLCKKYLNQIDKIDFIEELKK